MQELAIHPEYIEELGPNTGMPKEHDGAIRKHHDAGQPAYYWELIGIDGFKGAYWSSLNCSPNNSCMLMIGQPASDPD